MRAKICGINSAATMDAAVEGGAAYVGLAFYPPSPRALTPAAAALLAARVPPGIAKVGLFVDASDSEIAAVLAAVPLELLQLHGGETPERVAEIRQRHGVAVMKVQKVTSAEDLTGLEAYFPHIACLLFDAKAPPGMKNALPGGNALSFDWRLLSGRDWPCPWMLAGGLSIANVEEAVRISGAGQVDVSSGVEDSPGVKSVEKIGEFLAAVSRL